MAEVHGNAGSFSYAGTSTLIGVFNWTINSLADLHDTTNFADENRRKYTAGLLDWTATAECHWDTSTVIVAGEGGSLTLTVTGSDTYKGLCLIRDYTITEAVDDIVVTSVTFQGNGTLTVA